MKGIFASFPHHIVDNPHCFYAMYTKEIEDKNTSIINNLHDHYFSIYDFRVNF